MCRFNTNVHDLVVLVTDPDNDRFGQIGELTMHDWKEYGVYYVRFPDGDAEFPDGIMKDDSRSPIRTFYRRNDAAALKYAVKNVGLKDFVLAWFELNLGSISELKDAYRNVFNENLPSLDIEL